MSARPAGAPELRYRTRPEWPALAWRARCAREGGVVEVEHGTRVETRATWFGEVVWDGPYGDAGFDDTDLVFGSGGRAREGRVTFVSAGSTVDRLHSLESEGAAWVSNSLPCLLAAVGGSVEPGYGAGFRRDLKSIQRGLEGYEPVLETSAGPVRLTYFQNLAWREGRLAEDPKPYPRRDFGDFRAYRDFMTSALNRLATNGAAEARTHRYELLATVSSGYDSPTVAALAKECGLRRTLSFATCRDGQPDSGAEVARNLGLEPIVIPHDAWRDGGPLPEVPFLVVDGTGEDVFYAAVPDLLRGRLLLTGYNGSLWNTEKTESGGPALQRSDTSGLSLAEYRLHAGFIHCPVPFFAARQEPEIRAIGRSPDMAPWDIGGDYNRPICRRILETAGVPREAFGMEKRAASVLFFRSTSFLTPESRRDYEEWRRRHLERPGLAALAAGAVAGLARTGVRAAQSAALALGEWAGSPLLVRLATSHRLRNFSQREPLYDHLFPWALERAKEVFSRSPGEQPSREPAAGAP